MKLEGDTKHIPVGSCVSFVVPPISMFSNGTLKVTVVGYIPGVHNCYEIRIEEYDDFDNLWIKRAFVPGSALELISLKE